MTISRVENTTDTQLVTNLLSTEEEVCAISFPSIPQNPQPLKDRQITIENLENELHGLISKGEKGGLGEREVTAFKTKLEGSQSRLEGQKQYHSIVSRITSCFKRHLRNAWGPTAFWHKDQWYAIRETTPDGACALHALLGEELENGVYRFKNAKQEYTQRLKTAVLAPEGNEAVKTIFKNTMTNSLSQTGQGDRSANMLFQDTPEGRDLKTKWDALNTECNETIRGIKDKIANFWVSAYKSTKAISSKIKDEINNNITRYKKECILF